MKAHNYLLYIMIFGCIFSIQAQEKYTISGQVTDMEGEPLIAANVYLHETLSGSTTDESGKYMINNVSPGTYHLHVEYLGYEAESKTIRIKSENVEADFSLHPTSLELSEVVVETSPLKTKQREHSQSINIINERELEKSTGNTLSQILSKKAGISSINTGAGISKPVIRGMSFNRVVITENGIKQEGQQWGAEHGLELDAYNIRRVEIVKGPGSILYGSDAMGGVLHIHPPSIPKKNSLSGEILSEFKTVNGHFGTSLMTQGNKNNYYFRLRSSVKFYDDYKVPADSFKVNNFILPIHDRQLKNTAGEEIDFSGTIGTVRPWGRLSITASDVSQKMGFFPGAFGTPDPEDLQPDDNDDIDLPFQEIDHKKLIMNGSVLLKKNWLEWDAGYQQNFRREMADPHGHGNAPEPDNDLALSLILQTFSLNTRFHHQVTDRLKQVYGISGQYQINETGGYEFLLPEYISATAGAYIYQDYRLSKSKNLNAGIRYDAGQINTDPFYKIVWSDSGTVAGQELWVPEVDRFFHNISATGGISWYPEEATNLKMNLGLSYRIPSAAELTANGVHHGTFRHEQGNPRLNSERGYQFDLVYEYHTADFMIRATPFFNYFNNYIFINPTGNFSTLPEAGQVYRYEQAEALLTGGELQTEYHIKKHIHLGLAAEYVFAQNLSTNYPLPFTPPFSLFGDIEYIVNENSESIDDLFINFTTNVHAPQDRTARNEPETPGFVIFSAGTGFTWKGKKQDLKLFFNVDNILNTKYFNHLSRYRVLNIPEPGRNFNVKVVIPFRFNE